VQDAQAGAGDDADRAVRDLVLAGAEQHEVALEQPLQEVGDLVHLLARVAGGAAARDRDHVVDPLGQLREIPDDLPDVEDVVAHRRRDLLQLVVREPQREVEVHDGLAPLGVARRAHADDPPGLVALDADDRMQQPRDRQPALVQLAGRGVDEERIVVAVGLDDRAERLVAVL
jgi:hypothetical protein